MLTAVEIDKDRVWGQVWRQAHNQVWEQVRLPVWEQVRIEVTGLPRTPIKLQLEELNVNSN